MKIGMIGSGDVSQSLGIVIDVTHLHVFSPNGPPALALGHTDSGGEQVQRWLPGARVVKAFNIINHAYMDGKARLPRMLNGIHNAHDPLNGKSIFG